MVWVFWNNSLLVCSIGLLLLTTGPQPRFHASIMLCTGLIGVRILQTGPGPDPEIKILYYSLYLLLNCITLLLSPLQIAFVLFLGPKRELNHGIEIHYQPKDKDKATVDIVAVHGLGSNPDWAWTWEDAHTQKKCMWLKDLLPNTLPRARIMAYNHNSAWFREAPVKSVRVCGEQLLYAIESSRKLPQEVSRPIIFVGHSFGGIIIKQAMVLAAGDKQSEAHKAIEKSVKGVMFLGVPHDGSQLTAWGKLLAYCTYWLGSSTELLEALQTGAGFLRDLNRDFNSNYGNMRTVLVDFIELHKTKRFGLPLLMGVDAHSGSTVGVPRIPLESDHIGMNKFRAETEHNYKLMRGQIQDIVDRIEKAQSIVISSDQREYLRRLSPEGADTRFNSIERAHKSTLTWVRENPVLHAWIAGSSQIVWVTGKPGSGKSTLAKFVFESATSPIIRIFFSDHGREHINSVKGFFQTLLHQLLKQKPALLASFMGGEGDLAEKDTSLSVDMLRDSLMSLMKEEEAGSARIIIDAFDESSEECKSTVLPFLLHEFAKLPSAPQILITSRPHANLETLLCDYPTIKMNKLNRNDIYEYVSEEISRYHGLHRSDGIVKSLVQKMVGRSEGVFLWVRLVAAELRKGKMIVGTFNELQRAIDSLPDDLASFYDRILDTLDMSPESETRRMFEWVLFASSDRPQGHLQLSYAVAMASTSQRPKDIDSLRSQVGPTELMEARIKEYSGGLLEVGPLNSYENDNSLDDGDQDGYGVIFRADESDGDDDPNGDHVLDPESGSDSGSDSAAEGNEEDRYWTQRLRRGRTREMRKIVQVIHQSVKEYLLRPMSNRSPPVSRGTGSPDVLLAPAPAAAAPAVQLFVPGVVHARLAKACISFLAFPDFDRMWRVPSSSLRRKVPWPYVWQYAIYEWHYHASRSGLCSTTAQLLDFGWPERRNLKEWYRCFWDTTPDFYLLKVAVNHGLVGDVKHCLSILKKDSHPEIARDARILIWMSLGSAVENGHLDIIKLLLEADRLDEEYPRLDLASKNEFLEEALQSGIENGHVKVVVQLLDSWVGANGQGADYRKLLSDGLICAINHERAEIVESLAKRGANLTLLRDEADHRIWRAATRSRMEIIQLFIHYGSKLTPTLLSSNLHIAINYSHMEMAEVLLKNKANVNATDEDGNNALQQAIERDKVDIVLLLLKYGVDIDNPPGTYKRVIDLVQDTDPTVVRAFLKGRPDDVKRLLKPEAEAANECTDCVNLIE